MTGRLHRRPARVGEVTTDVVPLPGATPEPDDAEVGRRFAAGDEQALAWAYERFAGQIHGMAVRAFGPGPDAEDVTQQTFVSAWTGRAGYRPDQGPLPAWLVGVCRHKIADTWARRDRQRRAAEAAISEARSAPEAGGLAVDTAVARASALGGGREGGGSGALPRGPSVVGNPPPGAGAAARSRSGDGTAGAAGD